MTDVTTAATIASLRSQVEALSESLEACYKAKAHLVDAVGEAQMQEAACRAEVNRLSKYAERLLAENVRLSNEASTARERAGVLEAEVRAWRRFSNFAEDSTWFEAWEDCKDDVGKAEAETDTRHALDAAKFGGSSNG